MDRFKCQGHAQCAALSNGFYELDEDGFVVTPSGVVEPSQEKSAKAGAASCPEGAITISLPDSIPNRDVNSSAGEVQGGWAIS